MGDEQLRRVLVDAVPDLPAPTDRIARVGLIVRRRQRQRVAAVAGAVAAVVLAGGLWAFPKHNDQARPPADAPNSTASAVPSSAVPGPTTATQAPAPNTGTGSAAVRPGVAYDPAKIAPGAAGVGRQLVNRTGASANAGDGLFRTLCRYSHMRPDDPLRHPGAAGAAPLTMFAGNTAVTAGSTAASVAGGGNSTCWGGTADHSAYWSAAVIDTRTDAPVAPREVEVHYLAYYPTPAEVRAIPTGLRMVADQGSWGCWNGTTAAHQAPVRCSGDTPLVFNVWFPRCWNGRDLDSADRSHMVYPAGERCPADHPVPLPQISYHVLYTPPANGDPGAWRLSTGIPAGRPASESAQGGFIDGWVPDVRQVWTDNCVRVRAACYDGQLGDGRVITAES